MGKGLLLPIVACFRVDFFYSAFTLSEPYVEIEFLRENRNGILNFYSATGNIINIENLFIVLNIRRLQSD